MESDSYQWLKLPFMIIKDPFHWTRRDWLSYTDNHYDIMIWIVHIDECVPY